MNRTATLLGSVATAAFAACLAPTVTWAQEKTDSVAMTQKGMEVRVGGHINKAVLWASDGDTSRTMVVDNSTESTRFNLTAEGRVTKDLGFGATFEYEMNSNPASGVTLQGNGDFNQGSGNFSERIAEVFIEHQRLGTLFIGQGHTATDEIIEADLSGTQFSGNNAKASEIGGAILFFNKSARTAEGSPTPAEAIVSLNGLDLQDRIRYSTPTIAGFQAAASFVSGGAADVALRYGDTLGPFEIAAAVGYFNQSSTSTTIEDGIAGSGSVLHESGFNLTVAGGRRSLKDRSRTDPDYLYGKIGYIARIFSVGTTNFGLDYGVYNDFAQNRDEAKLYSIGVVQHFKDIGSAVYLLAKSYTLDRPGTNFDDIWVVMTGAKVNF